MDPPPSGSAHPASSVRRVGLYNNSQTILILGGGNLSFSRAVVRGLAPLPSPLTVVASTYDAQSTVVKKYNHRTSGDQRVLPIMEELKEKGATLLFQVDATQLSKTLAGTACDGHKFQRVVFNFPHTGVNYQNKETSQQSVQR